MNHESLLHGDFIPQAAEVIQSALSDLLEKADIILCEVRDRNPNKIALMKALEPWTREK